MKKVENTQRITVCVCIFGVKTFGLLTDKPHGSRGGKHSVCPTISFKYRPYIYTVVQQRRRADSFRHTLVKLGFKYREDP